MGGQIYFGTKQVMSWIPAPKISMARNVSTWNSGGEVFLNGGTSLRNSRTGHRTYELDWSLAPGIDIDIIYAYADRAYGEGPFYFVDPGAANYNLFPHYYADPALAAQDAPLLYGTARPTLITTPTNTQMYPINSAVYTVAGTGSNFLWIPVPAGYTLHLGFHGSVTGTGVVQAVTDAAVATSLTPLLANTTTRTNYTYTGPGGISVRLGGTGTVTVSGLIAQLRKTGVAVPTGGWIPGKGNSGCDFSSYPEDTLYNAARDFTHVSAELKEVGAWL